MRRGASDRRVELMILHGFTGNAEVMDELARAVMAAMTCPVRLTIPTLWGHLGAAPIGGRLPTDVAEAAARLTGLVAGRGTPTHVIGYSMGGRIALAMLDLDPRVVSVTTIGARPGLADDAARSARRASDEELVNEILGDGVAAFADRWESLELFQRCAERCAPATHEQVRLARRGQTPEGLADSLRSVGLGMMDDMRPRLALSDTPHLAIVGSEDERLVDEWTAAVAGGLGATRLAVVQEAGHAVHLERPARVARLVADHILAVERAGASDGGSHTLASREDD